MAQLCASSSAKAIKARGRFFTQGVILTTATGAGETALLRRSALAGPVVNNAFALFKSLEITPQHARHFDLTRIERAAFGDALDLRDHDAVGNCARPSRLRAP